MLRLTYSFCRYLKVAHERINTTHVRSFTYISCKRKTCADTVQNPAFTIPFYQNSQQSRLLANIKKCKRVKKLFTSNEPKRSKQMSESSPTVKHVSHGGKFEISTEINVPARDDSPKNQWFKDTAGSSFTKEIPRHIPSDFRVWESVGKKSSSDDKNTFKFRVISYNVLAQYLLESHPYLYTDCSPKNLNWNVRAARLYEEITQLAPDILCLQEVQVSHLNTFYSKFEKIGYCGIFKQKTGHRQDGCAIYFKQSLFKMEDHISVEFYQPELPILNRDNIGIMVKLVPRSYPGIPIVVATTHLLYNPKRTDVRLAQLQVFLAEIDRFAYYNNGRECGHLPIVLTGDFNSMPDSAVVSLLDNGRVSASPFRDSSDWERIGVTDNCQHLAVILNRQQGRTTDFGSVKLYHSDYSADQPSKEYNPEFSLEKDYHDMFNSGLLGHSLQLISTYEKWKTDGRLEATTFQDYWVTVDYIYFSALRLVERLRLPTVSECDVLGRLPNDVYGSDHIALGATFELRPTKSAL